MKKLEYTRTKVTATEKLIVSIKLDDECKNGICDFSITADTYKKAGNGHFYWSSGGCQHKEILKAFPQFKQFVDLHLCNHYGQPMYPVENGMYFIEKESKESAMRNLRITEQEYFILSLSEDKKHFKYMLFELGIVDRWNQEAQQAISKLEKLTEQKWENPYTPEEERFTLIQTDEEKKEVEDLIASGYYSVENILARKEQAEKEFKAKKRNEIINRYNKDIKEASDSMQVMLYIFDSGIPVDNVIYYNHKNTVVFNWNDGSYYSKTTREQFDRFVSSVDYSKLPEGIKFEIKNINQ